MLSNFYLDILTSYLTKLWQPCLKHLCLATLYVNASEANCAILPCPSPSHSLPLTHVHATPTTPLEALGSHCILIVRLTAQDSSRAPIYTYVCVCVCVYVRQSAYEK